MRDISIVNNDSQYHTYRIYVSYTGTLPSVRFDLSYAGDVDPIEIGRAHV